MLVYLSFITAIEISSSIDIDLSFMNFIISSLILLLILIYRLRQNLLSQLNDPKKYDEISARQIVKLNEKFQDLKDGNDKKSTI